MFYNMIVTFQSCVYKTVDVQVFDNFLSLKNPSFFQGKVDHKRKMDPQISLIWKNLVDDQSLWVVHE